MLCRTFVATASRTSTIESSIQPPLLDVLSPRLSTKIRDLPRLWIRICFLACSAADAEADLTGTSRPKPRRIDQTVTPRGFAYTACCTPRPLAACHGSDHDSVM